MTDTKPRSKFVLSINQAALSAASRADAPGRRMPPVMTGAMQLSSGEEFSAALWLGKNEKSSRRILRGQVRPKGLEAALDAALPDGSVVDQPQGFDLKHGEIVLFQATAAELAANPKRPQYFGYANVGREHLQRVSAWARKGKDSDFLSGEVEDWMPRPPAEMPAATRATGPATPQGKGRAQAQRAPHPDDPA